MQIQLTPAALPPPTNPPVPGAANPEDVTKFEEVFYLEPINAPPAGDPLNLDRAFFQGLENVNRSHDTKVHRLEEAIDKVTSDPELTMSSILRVQVELASVSFHEQLTVKVADKTSEGIKTLFRNQ